MRRQCGSAGEAPRLRQLLTRGLRPGRVHFYEIECLRGLAVLLVFLFHARGITGGNPPAEVGLLTAFAAVGNSGVTLFFVLSGFLLGRPWLAARQDPARERPGLRSYALARLLRILPLYYGAVLVAAVDLAEPGLLLPAATFQMLGFQYFPHSVVWWTLITELQFYLLLPLLGTLLLSPRGRWLLSALLGLWLLAYLRLVLFADDALQGFWLTKSLFARLPAFLLGMLVAALPLRWPWAPAPRAAASLRPALALAALIALALLLRAVAAVGESWAEKHWPAYHLPEALAWSALLAALAGGAPAAWRLPLVNPAFAVLGKLSYSIYLNHVPLLFYIVYPATGPGRGAGELLLRVVAAALASLALAAVTYAAVERPFLHLKERLR